MITIIKYEYIHHIVNLGIFRTIYAEETFGKFSGFKLNYGNWFKLNYGNWNIKIIPLPAPPPLSQDAFK